MIDTVLLKLDTSNPEEVKKYLSGTILKSNEETGEVMSAKGRLDNLNVYINNNSISIHGSLSRYYLGNNAYILTRPQIKEALLKLSDCLHKPFDDARVSRLHLSENMIMNKTVGNYFDLLGCHNGIMKDTGKDTNRGTQYYYITENTTLLLYDKTKQLKKEHLPIPDEFIGFLNRVLRYELQFNKRMAVTFKKQIWGSMLYEQAFYNFLVKKWQEGYNRIDKLAKPILGRDAFSTPKSLRDSLAGLAYAENYDTVNQQYASAMSTGGKKHGETRKRWNDMLNRIKAANKTTTTNELIAELDNKVNEKAEFHLGQ